MSEYEDQIIELAIKQKLISEQQLQECLKLKSSCGRSLIDILIEKNYITKEKIGILKAGIHIKETQPLSKLPGEITHPVLPKGHPKYRLLKKLGEGGMGEVWLAQDKILERPVALKFLLRTDKELLQRFLREAKTYAALDHPNIVKIYEIGQINRTPFISMQYIEGETLAHKQLSLTESLKVIMDIARALYYVHKKRIIHRDIKPSNIIIDKNNRPYLMDFGIAKWVKLEKAERLTQTGDIMGTIGFMPPEQARGDMHQVDELSDIYSLGATLFYLATGDPPFKGHPFKTLQQIIYQEPTEPRKIKRSIPLEVEAIILKAMHKNKEKRYQNAEQMAQDIENFLSGRPVKAKPAGVFTRIIKRVKRYKYPLIASACVFVLLFSLFLLLPHKEMYEKPTIQDDSGVKQKETKGEMEQILQLITDGWRYLDSVQLEPGRYTSTAYVNSVNSAVKSAEKAISIKPTGLAYFLKGSAFEMLFDFDKAKETYLEGKNLDPSYLPNTIAYATLLLLEAVISYKLPLILDEKMYQSAMENFKQAVNQIESSNIEKSEILQVLIKISQQEYKQALEICRTHIEKAKDAKAFARLAVIIHLMRNEIGMAVKICQEMLKIKPPPIEFLIIRVMILANFKAVGREHEANEAKQRVLNVLSEFIKINPNFYLAHYFLGQVYLFDLDLDKAIDSFSHTIDIKGDFSAAYFGRAMAYYKKGQMQEGITDCNKGLEINPSFSPGYYLLGLIEEAQGNEQKAKEYREKARKLMTIRDNKIIRFLKEK